MGIQDGQTASYSRLVLSLNDCSSSSGPRLFLFSGLFLSIGINSTLAADLSGLESILDKELSADRPISVEPSPTPKPVPTAGATAPITDVEVAQLRKAYLKFQATEKGALTHRQNVEKKAEAHSKQSRLKEFDRTQTPGFSPVERKQRRDTLTEELEKKAQSSLKSHQVEQELLKEKQKAELTEFEASLSKHERPPETLW